MAKHGIMHPSGAGARLELQHNPQGTGQRLQAGLPTTESPTAAAFPEYPALPASLQESGTASQACLKRLHALTITLESEYSAT